MTWLEPLHRRFYRERKIDAVKSTLRRLTGKRPPFRYLQPDLLDSRRYCFRLTAKAAKMLGFPARAARPLGRNALIGRYGLQWFIEVDGGDQRWLCNPREYPEVFAASAQRASRTKFYVEKRDGGTVMGIAVVDLGSDARRMTRRVTDLLDRYLQEGWINDLIAADRFEVSFLTISQGKADALTRYLDLGVQRRLARRVRRLNNKASIPARAIVVSGLIDLVPPASETRGK